MKTKQLITLVAAMLLSIAAFGQTFTANTPEGVEMTFQVTNSTDKTVQVGTGGYDSPAIDKSTVGGLTIPATVTYGGVTYQVTTIGSSAFRNCSSLTSVDLSSCTSIGERAFSSCSSLTSVGDLSSCTYIGDYAFYCCSSLTSVGNLSSCTSIGGHTFGYCSSLTSVGDLSSCISIGGCAFVGCSSLTSITLPSTELVALGDANAISSTSVVLVPGNLIESYKTAENWSNISNPILPIGTKIVWDVTLTPSSTSSAVMNAIGEANLANVVDLKITGDINGYDFNILRNKMPNLHHLDLENVNIIANDYKYYSDYSSEDNELGNYVFRDKSSLISVKLPRTITTIDEGAFQNCFNLREVTLFRGLLEIRGFAFDCCNSLREIVLPHTIQRINEYVFRNCWNLKEIRIPSSMLSIYWFTFEGCPIDFNFKNRSGE